jgi:hypothetical protein
MTHPAPLVRARPATEAEIPKTARALADAAEAAGWETWTDYARGTTTGARGEPTRLVRSVVLRARRGDHGVVATFADRRFTSAWLCHRHGPARRVGARELLALLRKSVAGGEVR